MELFLNLIKCNCTLTLMNSLHMKEKKWLRFFVFGFLYFVITYLVLQHISDILKNKIHKN